MANTTTLSAPGDDAPHASTWHRTKAEENEWLAKFPIEKEHIAVLQEVMRMADWPVAWRKVSRLWRQTFDDAAPQTSKMTLWCGKGMFDRVGHITKRPSDAAMEAFVDDGYVADDVPRRLRWQGVCMRDWMPPLSFLRCVHTVFLDCAWRGVSNADVALLGSAQVWVVKLIFMCNVTDISPLARVRKVRKSGGGGACLRARACARAERESDHVPRRH